MQKADTHIAPPEGLPRERSVKFIKPFKWSPHGWDIEKCKPGETKLLPNHIADIALADGAGIEVKIEPEVEEIKTDPEASTEGEPVRRGRGRN